MAVRATMAQLIARTRLMIQDTGTSPFFADQDVQDTLDNYRDDVRYLPLSIAPTILNAASTNNIPSVIFADYYSTGYQWWESDVVIQGNNVSTLASWVVLTPTTSDYIVGHWTFEANIFTSGTAPGQYPPLFATGKVYDLNMAAADLLEFWGAASAAAYDINVDGQSLRRSQLMTAKLALAEQYRRRAKPRIAKSVRSDVAPPIGSRKYRLLDSDDILHGA